MGHWGADVWVKATLGSNSPEYHKALHELGLTALQSGQSVWLPCISNGETEAQKVTCRSEALTELGIEPRSPGSQTHALTTSLAASPAKKAGWGFRAKGSSPVLACTPCECSQQSRHGLAGWVTAGA